MKYYIREHTWGRWALYARSATVHRMVKEYANLAAARRALLQAGALGVLLLAQAAPPPDASDTEWQRYCGLAYTLSHHNPNAPKPAPVMECKRRDAQS